MDISKLDEIVQYFTKKFKDPSYDLTEKGMFKEYADLLSLVSTDYDRIKNTLILIGHKDNNLCPDDFSMLSECSSYVEDTDCERCWKEALEAKNE